MVLDQQMTHDAVLPHVPKALDSSVMKSLFQDTMFEKTGAENPIRIRDCEILHIRYKRGRYCLVLYKLTMANLAHQDLGEQMVCARMFHTGESHAKFLAAQLKPQINPTFGRPLFHLPACEMVIWAFPNDRKLSSLASFTNHPQLQGQILPRVLEMEHGPGWDIHHLTNDIVHYVPEHTCMFRMSLRISHKESRETRDVTLYGKTYSNEIGAETYQFMQQLWNSEARRKNDLLIPQPLWYDHSLQTLWQSSLHGSPLTHYSLQHEHMNTWLTQAGKAVATLHQIPLRGLKRIHTRDALAKLEEATQHLSGIRASCGPALNHLVDELTRQVKDLTPQPQVTLHGDLHRKNLFLQGETIGLIDLDSLGEGSALHDIGSFVASLYYRIVISEIPESAAKELITSFVDSYHAHSPWFIPSPDLAWYVAMSLITEQARRCGTTFKADRLEAIDDLLEYARTIITCQNDTIDTKQTTGTSVTVKG